MNTQQNLTNRVLGVLCLMALALVSIPAFAGINVWTTNGPYGSSVHSLALDPQVPTTIYAGASGRVYKSTDAGGHWEDLNQDRWDDEGGALLLAVDPKDSNVLYTGGFGLFKSTDGGCSWAPADMGIPGFDPLFTSFAIDPLTPATLYLGTNNQGLFKSINGGSSWAAINEGLPGKGIGAVALDPSDPWTLYAGVYEKGLFKSTNAGASWAACNSGLPSYSTVIAIAMDPVHPSTLYASTWSAVVENGVFMSVDGGATWTEADAGLPSDYYGRIRIAVIAVDPKSPEILYAGTLNDSGLFGRGVYKSSDGGAFWASVNNGLPNNYIEALAIDPDTPGTLYVGDGIGHGLFKTTDGGGSWKTSHRGIGGGVSALAVDPLDPMTLYAGSDGVMKSTDGGASWSDRMEGFPLSYDAVLSLAIDPQNTQKLYTAAYSRIFSGDIFKSADGGITWTAIHEGIPLGAVPAVIAVDPLTPSTLYLGTWYEGVFKSTDGGASWRAINDGLPDPPIEIWALAVDPLTPSTLYAGTFDRWIPAGLFKSVDAGATWFPVNDGLGYGPFPPNIETIVIDPHTSSNLFIYAENRYKSTDGGASWAPVDTGGWFPTAFDPVSPEIEYSAVWVVGVRKSTDGGVSWASMDKGLPERQGIPFLAVSPQIPSTLFAGSGRVFSITMEESVPGDCDGDGQVSIGEVQQAVNLFLGSLPPQCGMDCDGDGVVSIGEVQRVINGFLGLQNACYYATF